MIRTFTFLVCLLAVHFIFASPTQTTKFIRIDQFGYLPASRKVAVVADPQVGFNAAEAFSPGVGANQYQVRRWADDAIVFTGTLQAWSGGATHTQSGDKGWWFDFSALTTEGSYYIYDAANQVGSYKFEIGSQVYHEVLKHVIRTFYYQRINFAKQAPFTDSRWADAAWYEGSNQDRFATSRFAKGNMTTARDLSGGWMDAGDQNKYTTFAEAAVIQLMEAYRINPGVFADNYGIPESGNGVADLLDEVKYELDFLKRMQDGTGTNGFFLKVGVDNYNSVSPISIDTRPRYYLPECTSATLSGCAMFAVSGTALRSHPTLSGCGQDLLNRAEAAWARAKTTTSNFTTYQTNCDDGDIKSGDADRTAQEQIESAFVAAVYLYEATGNAEYKTFAEGNYTRVNPYVINWWGPYWAPQQLALLRLTTLPDISITVINNIRNQKAGMNYLYSVDQYNSGIDLYRGYMADDAYHWGHHRARSDAGNFNLDFATFNLNAGNHAKYKEVAEAYMHWFHGLNPLGIVMLSNMYAYGGDSCANEIYHSYFDNGTIWDNAKTSPYGPAPGYVTGGPNKNYTGTVANITNQPVQKAYKDWNTGYPENSWEITEPAIYSQASYIMLLARLMSAGTPPPPDTEMPSAPANLTISNVTASSLALNWTASTDNVGVFAYEVYQNGTLLNGSVSGTTLAVNNLSCSTSYSYYVRARDAAGNVSGNSNTTTATTLACAPVTQNLVVYDETIGADWADWSWGSTRNFNYTSLKQSGTRSVQVAYQAWGGLSFRKGTAVQTTATTQLRFWVYSAGTNTITIQTRNADETGASLQVTATTNRKKWKEIVVSMSQLGNPAQIKRIDIMNNTSGAVTMFFDNVRLTNVVVPATMLAAAQVSLISAEVPALPGEISISPMPARHEAVLSFTSLRNSIATLQIFDVSGRQVLANSQDILKGNNQLRLDVSALKNGFYLVKLGDYKTARLVVER
jgi:chitodextrinase